MLIRVYLLFFRGSDFAGSEFSRLQDKKKYANKEMQISNLGEIS